MIYQISISFLTIMLFVSLINFTSHANKLQNTPRPILYTGLLRNLLQLHKRRSVLPQGRKGQDENQEDCQERVSENTLTNVNQNMIYLNGITDYM